jgi:hypothetical protein
MLDVDAELQAMEDLFVRRQDGYINASVLCRAFGKKWRDYILFDHASYPMHDYLGALQAEHWVQDPEEFIQVDGGEVWVHGNVAISLAQWLSTSFHIATLRKFAEAVWGGPPTQEQLIDSMKPEIGN